MNRPRFINLRDGGNMPAGRGNIRAGLAFAAITIGGLFLLFGFGG